MSSDWPTRKGPVVPRAERWVAAGGRATPIARRVWRYYSVGVSGPASGALVGRDAELAVLDALFAQTAAGAGGVVLLTGEPGVGKTRLAREATERAAGAMVSWGACRESAGAPPFWPWMQVLRRLGGATAAIDAAEGAAA